MPHPSCHLKPSSLKQTISRTSSISEVAHQLLSAHEKVKRKFQMTAHHVLYFLEGRGEAGPTGPAGSCGRGCPRGTLLTSVPVPPSCPKPSCHLGAASPPVELPNCHSYSPLSEISSCDHIPDPALKPLSGFLVPSGEDQVYANTALGSEPACLCSLASPCLSLQTLYLGSPNILCHFRFPRGSP